MEKFNNGDRVIVISTRDGSKMSYDGKHVNCHGTVKRVYKENLAVELDGKSNKYSTSGYFYFKDRELKKEDFIYQYLIEPIEPVIGKLIDTKITDKGLSFKFQKNAQLSFSKEPKLYINTDIENVIFNDPATIVFWKDGTKTVVKCENETYDPEKGLAMAIAKRTLGNKGNYYETFKKWLPDDNAKTANHTNNWIAYNRLANALHDKKATKHDLYVAIQEAIGYLDI